MDLAIARCLFEKQKQDPTISSHFLGVESIKKRFSEGRGATFSVVARRHSLGKYFNCLDILTNQRDF